MRLLINDMKLNDTVVFPCVIQAASPRVTKAKKPYLTITMFDGITSLPGNYWDWKGTSIPEINNVVYNITGTVSEYQGQKQLNISAISTNTEYDVVDFLPKSNEDIADVYKNAIAFATENITDDFLRNLVLELYEDKIDELAIAPGALQIHHAIVGGTLIHSLEVAKIALAVAKTIDIANVSLVVAGALLHDIGKLYTYAFEGSSIVMTDIGKMHEHLYIGANMIETYVINGSLIKYPDDYAKLTMLIHIILSHHGSLELGSVVNTMSIEAVIVSMADNLDATQYVIKKASESIASPDMLWTDKVYTMNNRPVINYQYTSMIMANAKEADLPFE